MIDVFSRLKIKLNDYLNNGNDLKILCEKLHVCIVAILLAQNIPITFYRYFHFPIFLTWVNIAEISIYVFSLILFYNNKRELSMLVTAFGIPIIFIYILFFLDLDIAIMFKNSFWFLLSFMLIYIIILRRKVVRHIYIIFCLSTYFIPGALISYNSPGDFIKIIQILSLILIPYIISTFIEKQDSQIFNLNSDLKLRLQEKEILAGELKNKNEELITFSHIMSHDLKTPLNTILSFSNLIKNKVHFNNSELEKYFVYIENSATSMATLINDLLVYSQVDAENKELEIISLNNIIEKVKTHFQFDLSENQIMLKTSNLPNILGDEQMLKTLFHNLISNAVKYQPKNKVNHLPTISITHHTNKLNNFIIIEDNGIGIDNRYIQDLFEPFKRFHTNKDYEGTGLGMSICKKVMDKHNGQIELQSTSEKGSNFKLTFPKHFDHNL